MPNLKQTPLQHPVNMRKYAYFLYLIVFLLAACGKETPNSPNDGAPLVKNDSTYVVVMDTNIIYGEGLAHSATSDSSFAIPLKLDVYSPDNNSTNRPVFMFIHGGGFNGGIKHKPEIVDMAHYYASRGWVFVSIDYRTVQELGTIQGMAPADLITFYKGIAPSEWVAFALNNAQDLLTPYAEALELQSIYESLGVHNELATLVKPNGTPAGHGAWNGMFDGKGLFKLSFDFLVERQNIMVE